MSDFVGAALGTGFTCLMTVLGAACVCFFPGNRLAHFQKGMMGFAAGIMMAASVFSLLLPAIEQATRLGSVPWLVTGGGLLLGVALIVWMGRFLDEKMNLLWNRDHRRTVLLVLAVTLHNIPEGMAVGLSFALAGLGVEQFAAAAALALGIGIQNFPEGAAISLPLYQGGHETAHSVCRRGIVRRGGAVVWDGDGAVSALAGSLASMAVVGSRRRHARGGDSGIVARRDYRKTAAVGNTLYDFRVLGHDAFGRCTGIILPIFHDSVILDIRKEETSCGAVNGSINNGNLVFR